MRFWQVCSRPEPTVFSWREPLPQPRVAAGHRLPRPRRDDGRRPPRPPPRRPRLLPRASVHRSAIPPPRVRQVRVPSTQAQPRATVSTGSVSRTVSVSVSARTRAPARTPSQPIPSSPSSPPRVVHRRPRDAIVESFFLHPIRSSRGSSSWMNECLE